MDNGSDQVVMGQLGAILHLDADLRSFFSNLQSLCFIFLTDDGVESEYNHVSLTYPFLEIAKNLQFLLINDGVSGDTKHSYEGLYARLPASLQSLSIQEYEFWNLTEMLKGIKHCHNLRHLHFSKRQLDLSRDYTVR